MKRMIEETNRRRLKQLKYNKEHNITPKTIYKTTEEILATTTVADVRDTKEQAKTRKPYHVVAESIIKYLSKDQRRDLIEELKKEMHKAAKDLEFERAAKMRNEIQRLEKEL